MKSYRKSFTTRCAADKAEMVSYVTLWWSALQWRVLCMLVVNIFARQHHHPREYLVVIGEWMGFCFAIGRRLSWHKQFCFICKPIFHIYRKTMYFVLNKLYVCIIMHSRIKIVFWNTFRNNMATLKNATGYDMHGMGRLKGDTQPRGFHSWAYKTYANRKVVRRRPWMSTFSWVYKPYTFWDPSPQKKRIYQHVLNANNPHENNKNQAKKCTKKNVDFHRPPPKAYGLYTRENVDVYGRPLTELYRIWPTKYKG